MKKPYPSRDTDRWQHALLQHLSPRMPFAELELIRIDLFEYLYYLTFGPYGDAEARTDNAEAIQKIADRLKELTPIMARRLRRVLHHDRPFDLLEASPLPQWDALQKYWESAPRR